MYVVLGIFNRKIHDLIDDNVHKSDPRHFREQELSFLCLYEHKVAENFERTVNLYHQERFI